MNLQQQLFPALFALASCGDWDPYNQPPTAAITIQRDGEDIAASDPIILSDTSIVLTLSGRDSTDADGQVREYHWFRTDIPGTVHYADLVMEPAADSGMEQAADADASSTVGPFSGDPEKKPSVNVSFDATGSYRYTLYVRDDAGAFSGPTSVELRLVAD